MEIINEKAPSDEKIKGIEREMTADELAKVKAFLEKDEARWFIPNHSDYDYLRAEDIDPIIILCSSESKKFSDAEKVVMKTALPYYDAGIETRKLTTDEFEALLAKYMNVSFSKEMKARLLTENSAYDIESYYIEQFDAYYRQSSGDDSFYVGDCKGYLTKDGSYLILVCEAFSSPSAQTLLVLNPAGDRFYFDKAVVCSNQQTTTPTTPTPPPVKLPSFEEVLDYDADEVIDLINKAGCPEDKLPAEATKKLSDAEVKKIIDFLKDPEAMSFINSHSEFNFFSPEEMDLAILLHNNVSGKHQLTEDEYEKIIAELKAKYEDYDHMTDLLILDMSDCRALVKKYLGLDTINDKMTENLYYYLESRDAYYSEGGGVEGFGSVNYAKAWQLSDGNILVLIVNYIDEEISTVVLKPNGDSYLFVQSVYLPEYDVWK